MSKQVMEALQKHIGSYRKIGAALNPPISGASVASWLKKGVPVHHVIALENLSAGNVSRKVMRPDDWHLIWPDFVERPAQDLAELKQIAASAVEGAYQIGRG